jgi:argininosuccinate lyase
VRFAETRGCQLSELELSELQRFSGAIGDDVHAALTLEGSLKSRSHPGGTAPVRVKAAIAKARKSLG